MNPHHFGGKFGAQTVPYAGLIAMRDDPEESRWCGSTMPHAVQNLERTILSRQKWAQRGPAHPIHFRSFWLQESKRYEKTQEKKIARVASPHVPFVSKEKNGKKKGGR